MYFLSFQIIFSSASFTNFLQVVLFAFLIFPLYSFSFLFHISSCCLSLVLLNLFLTLFVSLRAFVNSSFHHLLLNGHILLRGVDRSIAFISAAVMSSASWSIISGVVSTFTDCNVDYWVEVFGALGLAELPIR